MRAQADMLVLSRSHNRHSHDMSGAYVFRLPLKHSTPFVLVGAEALVFDPKDF
jgi:hypothetical protein